MRRKLFLLLCLLPPAVSADDLAELVLPAGMGVNIHFVTGHETDLDKIAAAGFKFVRTDFVWASIEQTKGKYDWAAYDGLTKQLDKRGLRSLYILDYSNPLYEGNVESTVTGTPQFSTASPQHTESIAAYAAWAAAAVKHFNGHHVVWEIWNEPNGLFWIPKPNVHQYSMLALAAAKAIKQEDAQAVVMGPALSTFEPAYMDEFLKSGILEYLDAVSVHPYRAPTQSPETAGPDYEQLRSMIAQYAPAARRPKPGIICSEWGYTSIPIASNVTPETQAAFLVRMQLFNLFSGIPISIWYDWKNDGTDPTQGEQNFGTVTDNLKAKPAYSAVVVMTHEISGYRIESRLASDQNDFFLSLTKGRERKLVAWTTGQPHCANLALPFTADNGLSGVDGNGKAFTPQMTGGKLSMDIDALPKFVKVN